MNFQQWCDLEWTAMAGSYRLQLKTITDTVTGYCGGGMRLTPEQATGTITLLEQQEVPRIGKYQGKVSEQDKAWYASALKPDFATMLREASAIIHSLTS